MAVLGLYPRLCNANSGISSGMAACKQMFDVLCSFHEVPVVTNPRLKGGHRLIGSSFADEPEVATEFDSESVLLASGLTARPLMTTTVKQPDAGTMAVLSLALGGGGGGGLRGLCLGSIFFTKRAWGEWSTRLHRA